MDITTSSSIAQAQSYTNLSELNNLRRDVKNNDPRAIREVAQQFEALFTQMMLDSMQKASDVFQTEYSNSHELGLYQDLLNKQISIDTAQHSTFGIAELLMAQFEKTQAI